MDIAFHYFAVKALAIYAGFDADDAQLIAEYSQMVDDFDYYELMGFDNVPSYVKQDGFDIYDGFTGKLNPVQTGFLSDNCIRDYGLLAMNRFQKLTVAPFHFIYQNEEEIGKTDYRVSPATFEDLSLIWFMMKEAREEYRAALEGATGIYGTNDIFKRKTLMKIGVLLHIFADTYAHQMFSGFNDDVNGVELSSVTNNATKTDETKRYETKIVEFLKKFKDIVPKIGHMMLEHVPDLTHLSFKINYKNEHGQKVPYERDNTKEFITCCRQIFYYLCWCCNVAILPEDKWIDLKEKLESCFLTDISGCRDEKSIVNMLKPIWTDIFKGEINFDYDSAGIKNTFIESSSPLGNETVTQQQNVPEEYRPVLTMTANEDFYLYNVCAEEVLKYLYGYNPRR